MKRKLIMLTILLACIYSVGCAQKKSNEYVDLNVYLDITDIGGYEGMAVVIDGEAKGTGFVDGDVCYLPYERMLIIIIIGMEKRCFLLMLLLRRFMMLSLIQVSIRKMVWLRIVVQRL